MRDFEFYLEKKDVKKVSKDTALANSLINGIKKRLNSLKKLDSKDDAILFFETGYDCIREACDAILAVKGYKSYSHIASIAYLKKLNLSDTSIFSIDNFRKKRNGSKYYGEEILKDDMDRLNEFLKSGFNKLINTAKKLIEEE